jgi:hypothetical protein
MSETMCTPAYGNVEGLQQGRDLNVGNSVGGKNLTTVNSVNVTQNNLDNQVHTLSVNDFQYMLKMMQGVFDKINVNQREMKQEFHNLRKDNMELKLTVDNLMCQVKELKCEFKREINLIKCKVDKVECENRILKAEIVEQRNKKSKEFVYDQQEQLAMPGKLNKLADECNIVEKSEKYGVSDQQQSFGTYSSVEEIVNELEKEDLFFDGLQKGIHPMEFLKQVESKFDFVGTIEDSVKLRIARQCFRLEPRDWIRDNVFETYSEFKATFIETYWGFKEQAKLHKKIYCGKYVMGRKLSMSSYVKKMYREAQFLSYSIPEDVLVQNLIGHLPIEFRMVLINTELSLKPVLDVLAKAEYLKLQ